MPMDELRQISINDVVPQELLAESDVCILCQSITTHITPSGTPVCDEHWQAYQQHKDKWWQYLSIDNDIKAGLLPTLPCLICGHWAWSAIPSQNAAISDNTAKIKHTSAKQPKLDPSKYKEFQCDHFRQGKRLGHCKNPVVMVYKGAHICAGHLWLYGLSLSAYGVVGYQDAMMLPTQRTIICAHCLPPRYWAKLALPTKKEEIMKTQSKSTTTPITLSHSQLETWQQCQLKWRLTKIDKVAKAPSEALILGTAFHAALEEDGRRIIEGRARYDEIRLFQFFARTMDDELYRNDPNKLLKSQQLSAMRAKAQLMILKYIDIVQPTFKPISVESSFTFAVSEAVKFTGRIDAVTARGIVDWKTAGKPWEAGTQHSKDQAQAYLTALPEQSQVSFAVFSTDGNTATFQSLATQRDEAKAVAYKAKVLDIAEEIDRAKRSGQFAANVGPLCGWCEVLGSCTAGQAWLKMKGRVPQVPVIQAMREGNSNGE